MPLGHYTQETYAYDEYGNVTIKDANNNVLSQSAIGNRYMFTGREYDAETGLYYYRARYYDPNIGRFIQADPLSWDASDKRISWIKKKTNIQALLSASFSDKDISVEDFLKIEEDIDNIVKSKLLDVALYSPQLFQKYPYANNNPVNRTDPKGEWVVPTGVAIGVAITVGIAIAIEQITSTSGGETETPEWDPPVEPESIPPPGPAWPPQVPCGK